MVDLAHFKLAYRQKFLVHPIAHVIAQRKVKIHQAHVHLQELNFNRRRAHVFAQIKLQLLQLVTQNHSTHSIQPTAHAPALLQAN